MHLNVSDTLTHMQMTRVVAFVIFDIKNPTFVFENKLKHEIV